MNDIIPKSDQALGPTQRLSGQAYVTAVVDVESTEEGFVLRAEMPGVNKDGIAVTVENGDLILVGRRNPLKVAGELFYLERRPSDYRRAYELDPSIDTSKISARIEQGILTVTLPKAESVKPKKITVD
jgi:HSP20 family protein